jgi:hypothetical protein
MKTLCRLGRLHPRIYDLWSISALRMLYHPLSILLLPFVPRSLLPHSDKMCHLGSTWDDNRSGCEWDGTHMDGAANGIHADSGPDDTHTGYAADDIHAHCVLGDTPDSCCADES